LLAWTALKLIGISSTKYGYSIYDVTEDFLRLHVSIKKAFGNAKKGHHEQAH
jgi:hypothetical protein